MSKALIKVVETKHPVSEEVIGFRLKAAVPNFAGRNRRGDSIPAFRKPYLIDETGDYSMLDGDDLIRFKRRLAFLGYKEFEVIGLQ